MKFISNQRTLSDKVVPIEKKNEIQSFVENFFCIEWCIAYPQMILLLWILWEYTYIWVLRQSYFNIVSMCEKCI